MIDFSSWEFIRQHAVSVGYGIFGLLALSIAIFVHLRRRTNRRAKSRQALASCWLAMLSELSTALDRMKDSTHHLIRDRQHPHLSADIHKSEIQLHEWLREGFLEMAGRSEGKSLIKSLHKGLNLFSWNMNQATNTRMRKAASIDPDGIDSTRLQRLSELFDSAAIRLACNRHDGMVREWKLSQKLLGEYCVRHDLHREDALITPGDIPSDWQMDESRPWTIKGLADVGEHEWES